MSSKRENKGIQIASNGNIKKQSSSEYLINSQTEESKWYKVKWTKNRWICNCKDFLKNKKKCKHIYAVIYYLTLDKIKNGTKNIDEKICPVCHSKKNVIKRGKSYNQTGTVQRYYCKKCKKRFQGRIAFRKMKSKAEIITSSLDLYFRGLSLRQIVHHLKECHNTSVTHATIHNWIKKYVKLINRYVKQLTVDSSERWHADETVIRLNGRYIRLWTLLDSESRFLIATHLSMTRGIKDADTLIKNGVKKSNNKPNSIVTDGLSSYNEAIRNNFKSNSEHTIIHLQGPLTKGLNNRMERYNGTLKSRTKTMLHFKNKETTKTFVDGFNIYYNFIKKHSSLQNKTPAQAIGIAEERYNWDKLIKKSINHI